MFFRLFHFWIVLVYFYQCLQSSRSQVKSFVSFIQRNQRSTAFRALLHIYVDFACLVFNKTLKRKGQYVLHKVVICANLSTFMYEPKNFSVDSSFCWVHFCWVHRWKSKKKERQRKINSFTFVHIWMDYHLVSFIQPFVMRF